MFFQNFLYQVTPFHTVKNVQNTSICYLVKYLLSNFFRSQNTIILHFGQMMAHHGYFAICPNSFTNRAHIQRLFSFQHFKNFKLYRMTDGLENFRYFLQAFRRIFPLGDFHAANIQFRNGP